MNLAVTVDVEGSPRPDGDPTERDYECVATLDELLSTLAVPATLFVTPTVVEQRPDTVAGWRADGHAVGLHVHPGRMGGDSDWLPDYDQSTIESFLGEGADTFRDHLGDRPTLFRAGRWGFSESVLRALGVTGFVADASLRPSRPRDPYRQFGVTEFPMTVYGNALVAAGLRPFGPDAVALHADAYLTTLPRRLLFRAVTWRLSGLELPYLMVSLHDYDLRDRELCERIATYLRDLRDRRDTVPVTLPELTP